MKGFRFSTLPSGNGEAPYGGYMRLLSRSLRFYRRIRPEGHGALFRTGYTDVLWGETVGRERADAIPCPTELGKGEASDRMKALLRG